MRSIWKNFILETHLLLVLLLICLAIIALRADIFTALIATIAAANAFLCGAVFTILSEENEMKKH